MKERHEKVQTGNLESERYEESRRQWKMSLAERIRE
jgi:hypothetical protein